MLQFNQNTHLDQKGCIIFIDNQSFLSKLQFNCFTKLLPKTWKLFKEKKSHLIRSFDEINTW